MAAALALIVLAALTGLLVSGDPVRTEALHDGLHVLGAALFTGAGLLCLLRWRLTGLTRPAFIGVALLVLGMLGETLTTMAPVFHADPSWPLTHLVVELAASLAAVVLVAGARRAPAVDAGARPTRLLLVVALVVPLLAAAGAVAAAWAGAGQSGLPAGLPAACAAVVWSVMAVSEWTFGLERRGPWLVQLQALIALSFAAAAVAAWGIGPADLPKDWIALVAGLVALHGSWGDVKLVLSAQSQDLLDLTVDVQAREEKERSAQEHQEERLHEVRNVLAGIHGATATLRKYEDRLDPGVRKRLEDAVTGELRRLAHLVDPVPAAPVVDVDLGEALGPVVVAERELGADLWVDLHGACVRGRSADIATVVSALLVNARRHAAGSPVVLRAEASDGETRLYVEDRGAGVPLEHREAVFQRGERAGATAPGTGLGLYTARRLVTEMGGTLQVLSRPGGGASFVLTLPSGTTPVPAAPEGVGSLERRSIPRQSGPQDERLASG